MSIDIKELKHGDMISCILNNKNVRQATIYKEKEYDDEKCYICQNIVSGEEIPNKLGYDYSWVIEFGINEDTISNIKLLKTDEGYETIILEKI